MANRPRRDFLKVGVTALGLVPLVTHRSFAESVNDEVHIGMIGVGQRGGVNLKNFLNTKGVRVVAVSDVYTDYQYAGTFEDGLKLEVRSDFWGTKFTGENGWIHVNRNGIFAASDPEASEGDRRHPLLRELPDDFQNKVPNHYEDFINSVRSRKSAVAPAEAAHRASSFGQLAIAAIDAGRPLHWDPKAEKVIGDAELARHPRLGSRL